MHQTEYYHVTIDATYHPSPGDPPTDRQTTLSKRVDSLEDAREAIDGEVPVALDSGEPMHYDHGDGDDLNIGRIYHYWVDQYGAPNMWVDAWVTVERVVRTKVKYADVVPDASTELE